MGRIVCSVARPNAYPIGRPIEMKYKINKADNLQSLLHDQLQGTFRWLLRDQACERLCIQLFDRLSDRLRVQLFERLRVRILIRLEDRLK